MLTTTNTRTELTLLLMTMYFLFISCAEAEKNLHTTPNSQRLIDNLAIDEPLKYAALALDCELQNWADAMDEDWC